MMAVAVTPGARPLELRQRQQLDGVDPERDQMIQERCCLSERPRAWLPEPERADVQLVDDQVLDARWEWLPDCQLVLPELLDRDTGAVRPAHGVRIDHHATAHRPVKRGVGVRWGPDLLGRIDAAPPDLRPREDIGPVDGPALGVLDPEHVRLALEGREARLWLALPDAV